MELNEVAHTEYPGQAQIKPEESRDVEFCTREVMQALQKYGCDIAVAFLVTAAGNEPQVQIVKKPSE